MIRSPVGDKSCSSKFPLFVSRVYKFKITLYWLGLSNLKHGKHSLGNLGFIDVNSRWGLHIGERKIKVKIKNLKSI